MDSVAKRLKFSFKQTKKDKARNWTIEPAEIESPFESGRLRDDNNRDQPNRSINSSVMDGFFEPTAYTPSQESRLIYDRQILTEDSRNEAQNRSISPIATDLVETPVRQPSREPRPVHHRRFKTDTREVSSSTLVSWVPHKLGAVFPRYGHMVNIAGGKSDEFYLFGGIQGSQLLNDFYRIDPGTIDPGTTDSGIIECFVLLTI